MAKREKKIKKLRKARIWPSVVFFCLALCVAIAAVSAFSGLFLAYLVDLKSEHQFNNAAHIGELIGSGFKENQSFHDVIDYLENKGDTSAVYLMDKDRNPVIGFGGDTFDLAGEDEFEYGFSSNDKHKIFLDKNHESKLKIQNGDIEISFFQVVGDALRILGDADFEAEGWDNETVYSLNYWVEVPVEAAVEESAQAQGDNTAMVQCELDLTRKDILFVVLAGAVAFCLMLIPLVFLLFNVVRSIKHQKQLTKLYYTDSMTGGYNRAYIEENGEKQLNRLWNSGKLFAIVDLTLIRYQNLCVIYGVEYAENLLEQIDAYLKRRIGRKEICAHMAEGSFELLLGGESKEAIVDRVKLLENELVSHLGNYRIVFHSGIYFVEQGKVAGVQKLWRQHGFLPDLYRNAVAARRVLTDQENLGVSCFDEKILEEQRWQNKVEATMQSALENEEFQVYLQPKYHPVTEELSGAEALVRWISPTEGFVSPGRFIPIFEKNGFITKLDDYMISHTAALQARWIAEGKQVVPVSVNVSRAHFANPRLAEHIAGLVDRYLVPHEYIEIELTESAFFDDKEALLGTVNRLKELGFHVSMDDFGAGYSSLNSLKDLPLDVLKLDAEFFRGDSHGERGEIVVSEAIHLAKNLNMKIVAEGIEKKEQVDFLASQGCDMIQGYYFAKPMPANEYEQRMKTA